MRRTPVGMRELISRITVSASGRLTEPLKCTLLGGTAVLSVLRSEVWDPARQGRAGALTISKLSNPLASLEATRLMSKTANLRIGRCMQERETLIGSSPRTARRRHGIHLRGRTVEVSGPGV